MSRKGSGLYVVLVLSMALLGVWLVFDQITSRQRLLGEREQAALQTSVIISQAFSSFFLSTNYVLSDISGSIDAEDLVYPPDDVESSDRLNAFLKRKASTVPALSGIALYNKDCVLTARAVGGGLGFRLSDPICERLKELRDGQPHVEIVSAEQAPTGRAGILLMRNLPFKDGEFNGGLTAGIGIAFIQKWLDSFPLSKGDSLTIVDTTRILIARVPPLPEAVGKRSNESLFQQAFESGASRYTLTAPSPRDGQERIFGMTKTEGFPFYVIVGVDKASALRDWQIRAIEVWIGYVLLVVLFALLVRSQRLAVHQRELLARLAMTDELTGISNRRNFIDVGRREVDRAIRYKRPLSLLYIDIDRFKSINDRWGHPAGDVVLKELSLKITGVLRRQDTVGRIGGEEFAIILPETDEQYACTVAQSLRQAIEKSSTHITATTQIQFTLSIGVAALTGEDDSLDDLMHRADQALYRAKHNGRNQVASA